MKLYLVRHGEALSACHDSERPLSDAGRAQIKHLARELLDDRAAPTRIFHSGILRAQQTAEIIAEKLNVKTVEKLDGLTPQDDIAPALEKISTWTHDTMLVTHLPLIAYLLSALAENSYHIQFDTGTAVCLEYIEGNWQVQALLV